MPNEPTDASSKASETFAQSIRDAENLLAHFDKLNTKPPPPENEVLKRAGLIMAMTAWETYVEDRVLEAAAERLRTLQDATIAAFVQSKLDDDIRRLHNPSSEKTIQLFKDYAGVDLTDKVALQPTERRGCPWSDESVHEVARRHGPSIAHRHARPFKGASHYSGRSC